MKINHIGLFTQDLDRLRSFYETYLNAETISTYHNPKTGLQTHFLQFESGARLEIMRRPETAGFEHPNFAVGFGHISFSLPNNDAVDSLTQRLAAAGHTVVSEPRITGDIYYESVVLDPDGNQLELVAN